MIKSNLNAWSQDKSEGTLEGLRNDYPGYTDNELYAIWCVGSGRIPLDDAGKVLLEQWRLHAEEDGKHLEDGGFKVSRALYGRALRAEKGVPKAKRGRVASPKPRSTRKVVEGELSPKALEFAKSYDAAARLVNEIIARRRELDDLVGELSGISKWVASELAAASPEAKKMLQEAGVLK